VTANERRPSGEVFRYSRDGDVRICSLRVVAAGTELWRVTVGINGRKFARGFADVFQSVWNSDRSDSIQTSSGEWHRGAICCPQVVDTIASDSNCWSTVLS